jgi:uncharacterized membrane protein YraQ (UPF0718 family)
VVAFIFADLIVLPILNIYRKYYGRKMSLYLFVTFYLTMAIAGLIVETLFGLLGLVPTTRNASVIDASVSWNYTTFLNIGFLVLAAVMVVRFLRTGGLPMLRMMGGSPAPVVDEAPPSHGEYACPMHPEVRGGVSDRCPKCGMALERVS